MKFWLWSWLALTNSTVTVAMPLPPITLLSAPVPPMNGMIRVASALVALVAVAVPLNVPTTVAPP